MQQLIKLDNLIEGQFIKRPSKYIKTPYVADILLNNEEVLGHTASLGCCGLADVNATVLVSLSPESKSKSSKLVKNKANMRCSHTVYLSIVKNNNKIILLFILNFVPIGLLLIIASLIITESGSKIT